MREDFLAFVHLNDAARAMLAIDRIEDRVLELKREVGGVMKTIMLIMLALGGCAHLGGPYRGFYDRAQWKPAGESRDTVYEACMNASADLLGVDFDKIAACMQAKGYTR